MPELPEVETTMRGIFPHIHQQKIIKVTIRERRLRWRIAQGLEKILQGKIITGITRRAKYLLLQVNGGHIIIHLGMSGHLRILSGQQLADKHDHIDIEFANHWILRFNDPRRFGAFIWVEGDIQQHHLFKKLGYEPLTKEFNGKYLLQKARGRNIAVKSFLMNQNIVTGVGNIYAAEALFMAGIHPLVPVKNLSLQQWEKLTKAVKKILKAAIKKGGTTLRDFMDSEGKPGYFSNQLQVYGRAGKPCVVCGTRLQMIKIGQRSTVFCEQCQK